jgi:hypothetical protein
MSRQRTLPHCLFHVSCSRPRRSLCIPSTRAIGCVADLAQRSFFWKKVWGFLFFCVFFATCVVQRRRVVPLYTGLVSLYHGQSAFDAAHGAGPYQRVATSSEGASCKGAAPLQKPLAPAARATAVAKYTIGDMEDDNEDEAGFSAEL